MAYTFDPLFAADPNNPAMVAANAAITLFDPADVTQAAVTITDVTGAPLTNPVTVNKNGFGPAFQHATLDRLGWSGGGFTGYFTSFEGIKAAAVAAQNAAETAGNDAAAAASADLAAAVADAEAAQAAAATSATAAANSAALVNAPADTAVETLINGTGTATRTALNATFARVFTPEAYGAKADGKKVTNGSMSAASATLTSSSGLFTAGDVGKRIVIRGAGAAGVALGTTISGYTSATQVTLATPSVTAVSNVNVEWGTDDSAALQAALTAANDASGTLRLMGGRTYVTGSQLNMTDKAVRIEFQPGSKLLAAAAMTAVLHRPDGGPGTNTVLEQPVIDGGGVAERCLDVLRCHYFVINGGAMENATIAVADFGRTGSQCYEIEWNGGLVTGMSSSGGVPVSARPAYGIRSGVSTTDSNFMDLKVKNAASGVQDLGQANIWQGVHVYHYPFRLTSGGADWGEDATGFDVQGPHNRLIACYADTCETGFNLNGEFSEVTDSKLLWPSIHAPLYTPVGVKILKPGCIVANNQWYPGNPAEQDVTGIEVGATAWKPIIIGNTFGGGATGYAAGGPIVNLGAPDGVRYGNMWDGGVLTDFSNNHWLSTIFTDLGNANDVLFRWYGTNPGRMIAVGSGSTGYIRFTSDTADGGLMFGATGNKVGFAGAAPVLRQDANTDFETILSRFGLSTSSTVRPTRIGLNPRTADTTLTTQAGQIQSVDAIAGNVSLTLPATTTPGYVFTVKKTDGSANTVTLVGTIDGATNYVISTRWSFVTVVSTSTSGSWLITAKG